MKNLTVILGLFLLFSLFSCDDSSSSKKPDDPCRDVTCDGHGTCSIDGENRALCQCETGYHVEDFIHCVADEAPDVCAGVTCDGHGTCVVMTDAEEPYARCACDEGYVRQEETRCVEDPCAGVDCGGHGSCSLVETDEGLVPQCACDEGYVPAGLDCVLAVFCGDGVVNAPGEECDDGNADDADGCTSQCLFSCHSHLECPASGDVCMPNECQPAGNGQMCVSVPQDGNPCDDGNACTYGDACVNGVCTGMQMTCDDANMCTNDTCDPVVGCVYVPLSGRACDDFDVCTANDTCQNGVCVGSPISCDDGDSCTADSCHPLSGCVYTQLPRWYRDSDGDGFGAGTATCAATQPPGYTSSNTDCCDMNSFAYPGNSVFYTNSYNCGGIVAYWDYNCNNIVEKQYNQLENCTAQTTLTGCNNASGWITTGSIPNCGVTGQYITCRWLGSACVATSAVSMQQACH